MKPNRRAVLRSIAAAPVAAGMVWTEAEAQHAQQHAQAAAKKATTPAAFRPKFFTAHEYATVRLLVDLIIPKDERSGSATDAGVPQFMDFMMLDQPARQTAMRGGLAWLDRECGLRFEKNFLTAAPAQRTQVLDEIAWPQKATPEYAHGVAFFNSFRDLTASGFFTSKMGMDDLQYMGNRYVAEWTGCPPEVMKKLGVSLDGD
jgi:gluconate 2-dehydrogenase gamma chain